MVFFYHVRIHEELKGVKTEAGIPPSHANEDPTPVLNCNGKSMRSLLIASHHVASDAFCVHISSPQIIP